jgi:hypothetical protein
MILVWGAAGCGVEEDRTCEDGIMVMGTIRFECQCGCNGAGDDCLPAEDPWDKPLADGCTPMSDCVEQADLRCGVGLRSRCEESVYCLVEISSPDAIMDVRSRIPYPLEPGQVQDVVSSASCTWPFELAWVCVPLDQAESCTADRDDPEDFCPLH